MATYAIGDLQGCFQALQNLLNKINYNAEQDKLWFTGDLINRGPESLHCLRFVKDLVEKNKAVTVLGNHDLHFLAVANNLMPLKPADTLHEILDAPDFADLCFWLRQQPLFIHDAESNYCLVHAGLAPAWNLEKALNCTHELSDVLKSDRYLTFLSQMYGDEPDQWRNDLRGMDRLRFITNCFTRIRYCDLIGKLNMEMKSPLGSQPKELMPWFQIPWRKHKNLKILFGHWASLYNSWDKLDDRAIFPENIFPLDSGCVWGNALTALRLEDGKRFEVSCD